jgi:hypothetical protein
MIDMVTISSIKVKPFCLVGWFGRVSIDCVFLFLLL